MTSQTKAKIEEIAATLALLSRQLQELAGEEAALMEPEMDTLPEPAPSAERPRRPNITVNDRFRFIRELFGGNSDAYADALSRLLAAAETDGNLTQAAHDLGLDLDKPEAGELMDILTAFVNER